jgi:hypothetical protein
MADARLAYWLSLKAAGLVPTLVTPVTAGSRHPLGGETVLPVSWSDYVHTGGSEGSIFTDQRCWP